MATRPATAPEQMPITVGLPRIIHSTIIQVKPAAAVATCVTSMAMPACIPAETADPAEREAITVEVDGKRLSVVVPAALGLDRRPPAPSDGTERARGPRGRRSVPASGGDTLVSPMQGTIIKIAVADGERVSAGDVIVVLEAMKMEQPLTAHKDGTVTGLSVSVGQTVTAGAAICELKD